MKMKNVFLSLLIACSIFSNAQIYGPNGVKVAFGYPQGRSSNSNYMFPTFQIDKVESADTIPVNVYDLETFIHLDTIQNHLNLLQLNITYSLLAGAKVFINASAMPGTAYNLIVTTNYYGTRHVVDTIAVYGSAVMTYIYDGAAFRRITAPVTASSAGVANQILYGTGNGYSSNPLFTYNPTSDNFIVNGSTATFKVLNSSGKVKTDMVNEFEISSSNMGSYENPMFDIYTTGDSVFNGTYVSINDNDNTISLLSPSGNVQLGNNFFYNQLEKSLWVDSLTNMNLHGTDDSAHAWEIHQGDSIMGGPSPYIHIGYGTPDDSMIGFTVQNTTSEFGYKNNLTNNAWHIKASKQEHKLMLETDIDATHRGWAEWMHDGFYFTFFPSAGEYSYKMQLTNPLANYSLQMNSTNDTAHWQIFNLVVLTTTQRNALSPVAAGEKIFCSDCTANDSSTGVEQTYNGSAWKNLW